MWGVTAQLYSLNSKNNWGIGDFTDLKALVTSSAEQGAALVGVSPLHPLYYGNPAHRSPYSPSSRCFLNPLYIDVNGIEFSKACKPLQQLINSSDFQGKLAKAKASEQVDYVLVAELKYSALNVLYKHFCEQALLNDVPLELKQFSQFKQEQGEALTLFATFNALYQHVNAQDSNIHAWMHWPAEFQQPNSEAVARFQEEHAQAIDYFCFIQWLAHQQLTRVKEQAKQLNMPIGLYLDLAVGCDGAGSEVWSNQALYVAGASIGAPPDEMNLLGQSWGLTPINPVELKKQGYAPFIQALRASMQYAGAIRIDHILGLMRQYWVGPNMSATEGLYISFPFDDIMKIIALESQRNRCIVIGEDLGNVPDGFTDSIQEIGILSFKVMFFERWSSGLFKRPELYPERSVVTATTHDMATVAGWWQGNDLTWKASLNLYPNEEQGERDRHARSSEREMLIGALDDFNVIDMTCAPQQAPAIMNATLSASVQAYLAATPSGIQLISLEDLLESNEQVNIPGTIDQHPNWLQKLSCSVQDLWQSESAKQIVTAVNRFR